MECQSGQKYGHVISHSGPCAALHQNSAYRGGYSEGRVGTFQGSSVNYICITPTVQSYEATCSKPNPRFSVLLFAMTMKRVKTPLRNCLNIKTLDTLLRIRIEGPDMSDFDFELALNNWAKLCNRRIKI